MYDLLHTILLSRRYQRQANTEPHKLYELQQHKLERIVAHARAKSPFFQRLYADLPERGFSINDVPPVTKTQMMENFDEYCTDRRLQLNDIQSFLDDPNNAGKRYKGYICMHTSGTSGERAVMLYDKRGFRHVRAVNLARGMGRRFSWTQILKTLFFERLRIAAVVMDGGNYPALSNFAHTPLFYSLFVNLKVISIRQAMTQLVEQLNEFQPHIIMGYPSVLMQLGQQQELGNLSIFKKRSDHVVNSLSEPLAPDARRIIKRAFHCSLVDVYGSAECLAIAKSCLRSRGLHVNSDAAWLEIVDRDGNPVEPGDIGHKVYVTNFENRVQPIIRYELPDVMSWEEEPCSCGSGLPLIKEISGRTDDIVYISRKQGGFQVIHPYWLMVPLLNNNRIKNWQVIQTGRDSFLVLVIANAEHKPDKAAIEQSLRDSIQEAMIDCSLQWEVQFVDELRSNHASGKIRRIYSDIGPPQDLSVVY